MKNILNVKKNRSIDFLRFVFSIIIVYYHLIPILASKFPEVANWKNTLIQSKHGGLVVYIFFFMSGFFFHTKNDKTVFEFVSERIIRLWPVLFFSIMINFNGIPDFFNIFFIERVLGIVSQGSSNPASWYVCVLFWVSVVLYSFIKSFEFKKLLPFFLIIAFLEFRLITVYRSHFYYDTVLCFTVGILHGGGILMGIISRQIWNVIIPIFDNIDSFFGKFIFSILEGTLFVSLIYICSFSIREYYAVQNIMLYTIMIFVFMCNKGLLSKIFQKIGKVGDYSYSIYLMQFPTFYYMERLFWNRPLHFNVITYIITSLSICIIVGILTHYIIEKPLTRFLMFVYNNLKLKLKQDENF